MCPNIVCIINLKPLRTFSRVEGLGSRVGSVIIVFIQGFAAGVNGWILLHILEVSNPSPKHSKAPPPEITFSQNTMIGHNGVS